MILGLSGGIDSALVAAFAVEACGPKSVTLVSMPTQFNSDETQRMQSKWQKPRVLVYRSPNRTYAATV